jgi:hypothetical protein
MLDYRPRHKPDIRHWLKLRRKRLIAISVISLFTAIGVLSILHDPASSHDMFDDQLQLLRLSTLAKAMIAGRGPGVRVSSDEAWIDSTDAFVAYVRIHDPALTAGGDASHPIHSILSRSKIEFPADAPTSPDSFLLWSNRVYSRPVGTVQYRLLCNGRLLQLVQNADAPLPTTTMAGSTP